MEYKNLVDRRLFSKDRKGLVKRIYAKRFPYQLLSTRHALGRIIDWYLSYELLMLDPVTKFDGNNEVNFCIV